jgi:CubicO group peptidase (beta-lactamase class C family)
MLSTDDPASRYLPELTDGERITIEQLLTHTAGIVDVYSLDRFGATAGLSGSFTDVVADLCRLPLTGEPDERYAYSNGGYTLLAAIVERVSGLSYGAFLARRIFEPLGMTATAHDGPGPARADRVPGYDPWGARDVTPARLMAPAFSTGSGSLWSSAGDLLRWAQALHDGSLLNEASYAKLTHDHGHGYGYGVSVFQRFGREVIGHDGRVSGFASDLARYVDDGVTVVVLSNVQSVARDRIRRVVAAAVFDEEADPPQVRNFLDAPNVALEALTGVYSFGPGFDVTISTAGGRLLARANQGGTSELVPLTNGEWFSRMLDATVRFGRDENGAFDRLVWGRGEGAPEGKRLR